MIKNTKIVATIGPATETEETLTQLIQAGMNVARFNTKHSSPEWHNERLKRTRKVAKDLNAPVATLLDLQGPEVRINLPGETPFKLEAGETATFTSNESSKKDKLIYIPQDVIASLSVDNIVLLADGACEFIITKKGKDYFEAEAIHECMVEHRKTMNTPGVVLDMPSLTDRDFQYLEGVEPELVDFVGLSFVRDAKDVEILKKELKKKKFKAQIIAKIENQAALDNLDELIEIADVIMIARGDLGVEVPFQELTYWQKQMIQKCRLAAKPVITATQMLKSMVDQPRPTRAEVSDVAHAIYDGTDAVMLSEETTIGEYPVRAVETQAAIALYNEPFTSYNLEIDNNLDFTSSIAHSAIDLLQYSDLKVDRVVALTESGRTARLISRFRPETPIIAVTSTESTYRELALSYGVTPFIVDMDEDKLLDSDDLIEVLSKEGIVKKKETVLLVHGKRWKKSGFTNSLSIVEVK